MDLEALPHFPEESDRATIEEWRKPQLLQVLGSSLLPLICSIIAVLLSPICEDAYVMVLFIIGWRLV